MKSKLSMLVASISLIVCVSPANADSVVQLWSCELNEGKTRAELMEVSVAWMNAVKAMDADCRQREKLGCLSRCL
jgi:hypothetical protein